MKCIFLIFISLTANAGQKELNPTAVKGVLRAYYQGCVDALTGLKDGSVKWNYNFKINEVCMRGTKLIAERMLE